VFSKYTGWGTTSAGGTTSFSLQKLYDVPIVTNTACNSSKYKNKILAGMVGKYGIYLYNE